MKPWQNRSKRRTEPENGQSSPAPQTRQSFFSHLGIRWRLVGSFAMFVALLLMLLWLLQIVFLESFYKTIKTNSIKSTAQEIAASINDENFFTEVNRLTRQDMICVHIVRADGTPMLTSGNQPSCILHMLLTDQVALLFRQAEEGGGTVLENYQLLELSPAMQGKASALNASTEQLLYGILTTRGEGENAEPVMVMVDATITPINTTVETLRAQLVIITLIMTAFSVLLVLLLSSMISRPITRITDSAKQLATGDYTTRFTGGSYREVTELADTLNYASRELSKVERLRQEFIANVSHDLRTPLTMISGYAEVMRDLPGENTPENVQIIIDEAHRLTDLVNDLLDLSRLQSGAQQPQPEPLNLTDLIRGIMGRYAKLVLHDGYSITLEAEQDAMVMADRLRMTQVLYNLINNAINYAGSDRAVLVRQTLSDVAVRVEVIDHGEGIPAESLPYVWDRYYKVDKNHRRSAVGAGLGLSIVKGVLEAHGAEYGVESTVGKGSDFWFRLPLLPPEAALGAESEENHSDFS